MTAFDVETVMVRIRSEAKRRRATMVPSDGVSSPRTQHHGVPADLERKDTYVLGDFLAYLDAAFVRNAYLAALRRPPDEEGMAFYLGELRAGRMDRIDVLANLRWSDEGVARGVHIDGLLAPTLLRRWKRRRVIGPVLGWVHAFIRLGSLASQAWRSEATHASRTAAVSDRLAAVEASFEQRLASLENEFRRDAEARLDHAEARLDHTGARLDHAEARLDHTGARVDRTKVRLEHAEARLDDTGARVENTEVRLDQVEAQQRDTTLPLAVEVLHASHASIEASLSSLEASVQPIRATLSSVEASTAALIAESSLRRDQDRERIDRDRSLDAFYVAFEQRFRGSSELIRERMLPYLAIIADAKVGDAARPLLDVGCGNGDWLELLRQTGHVARGVDSNRTFVSLCQAKGLDVVEADVIEHLRTLPDESLGAVTGIHIAEHLPFDVLIQLLDECRRVLCHGGLLALETPNPENLLVGAHYFYMDPTHRNPLPPEALRWIVEARGFAMTRIERWTQGRPMAVPGDLDSTVPASEAVNVLLGHLRVAPDYAVIGRRL